MIFKELDQLRPDLPGILSELTKHSSENISDLLRLHPACPTDYTAFLLEYGSGALKENGEPFVFESELLSSEHEYFKDSQIYQNGAKGDILIFGWESMGTAYGFDTGEGWSIKEVDEYRIVTPLNLTFKQFIEGILICYPQIPMKYSTGIWTDGTGKTYLKQS